MMKSATVALAWLLLPPAFGIEYGVDVSYPMHHEKVSTNYEWLPHNLDHSLPTPPEYKDMVVQPLGDRESIYRDLIDGCRHYYSQQGKGNRCDMNEAERVAMSLRQPQSMVVSEKIFSLFWFTSFFCAHFTPVPLERKIPRISLRWVLLK